MVAVVLFFNEQNLNFFGSLPESLAGPWRSWLRKKYGNDEAFRKAWTNAAGKSPLKPGVTLDNVPLFDRNNVWETDARARDAGLFLYDLHVELLDWYVKAIREAGYRGPGDTVRLAPFAPRPGGPQPPAGDLHAQLPRPPFGLHEQGFAGEPGKRRGHGGAILHRHGDDPLRRPPPADHRIRPRVLEPLPLRGRAAGRGLRGPARFRWADGTP